MSDWSQPSTMATSSNQCFHLPCSIPSLLNLSAIVLSSLGTCCTLQLLYWHNNAIAFRWSGLIRSCLTLYSPFTCFTKSSLSAYILISIIFNSSPLINAEYSASLLVVSSRYLENRYSSSLFSSKILRQYQLSWYVNLLHHQQIVIQY